MSYKKLPSSAGVFLPRDILESQAFWELNSSDIRILLIFYLKRKFPSKTQARKSGISRNEVINNGKIQFTYKEAEQYGFSESTFKRSRNKLIEVGFIDISEYWGNNKPVKYAMSDRWRKYGRPDFVSVEPPEIPNYLPGRNTRFKKIENQN